MTGAFGFVLSFGLGRARLRGLNVGRSSGRAGDVGIDDRRLDLRRSRRRLVEPSRSGIRCNRCRDRGLGGFLRLRSGCAHGRRGGLSGRCIRSLRVVEFRRNNGIAVMYRRDFLVRRGRDSGRGRGCGRVRVDGRRRIVRWIGGRVLARCDDRRGLGVRARRERGRRRTIFGKLRWRWRRVRLLGNARRLRIGRLISGGRLRCGNLLRGGFAAGLVRDSRRKDRGRRNDGVVSRRRKRRGRLGARCQDRHDHDRGGCKCGRRLRIAGGGIGANAVSRRVGHECRDVVSVCAGIITVDVFCLGAAGRSAILLVRVLGVGRLTILGVRRRSIVVARRFGRGGCVVRLRRGVSVRLAVRRGWGGRSRRRAIGIEQHGKGARLLCVIGAGRRAARGCKRTNWLNRTRNRHSTRHGNNLDTRNSAFALQASGQRGL